MTQESFENFSGIEVNVLPEFDSDNSNPEASVFIYKYHIKISNRGARTVQLKSRHWIIADAFDNVEEVRGPGVVGQTPVLSPGESFEYTSFCPLSTPTGSMKGSFNFALDDKSNFEVPVTEFKFKEKSLFN